MVAPAVIPAPATDIPALPIHEAARNIIPAFLPALIKFFAFDAIPGVSWATVPDILAA